MTDSPEIEKNIREHCEGATSRIIEDVSKEGVCVVSGKKVKTVAWVARGY